MEMLMILKKYIIMLTFMLVLPSYSADNTGWWQRMKPYMTRILGVGTGGAIGAAFAPRLQQNRYLGALCGAGLGLSAVYLGNWLYKQYKDRDVYRHPAPGFIRQTKSTSHHAADEDESEQ